MSAPAAARSKANETMGLTMVVPKALRITLMLMMSNASGTICTTNWAPLDRPAVALPSLGALSDPPPPPPPRSSASRGATTVVLPEPIRNCWQHDFPFFHCVAMSLIIFTCSWRNINFAANSNARKRGSKLTLSELLNWRTASLDCPSCSSNQRLSVRRFAASVPAFWASTSSSAIVGGTAFEMALPMSSGRPFQHTPCLVHWTASIKSSALITGVPTSSAREASPQEMVMEAVWVVAVGAGWEEGLTVGAKAAAVVGEVFSISS